MSENKCWQSYHLRQCLREGAVGIRGGPGAKHFFHWSSGNINSHQMKCVTDEKAGGVVDHAENKAVIQSD